MSRTRNAHTHEDDLARPELFINRELSWLEFNQRVLEEAEDPTQPLLERLKFLSIVSSNLDEFFEIRVGGLKQQIENDTEVETPDGLGGTELFTLIRERTEKMVRGQYDLWNNQLIPALAEQGIRIFDFPKLTRDQRSWARRFFEEEVYPVLTPLALDPSHPFPQLQNKSHNLIVELCKPAERDQIFHAVVQIPRVLKRLVQLPADAMKDGSSGFLYLKSIIKNYLGDLFPGLTVRSAYGFRITRNSDLYIDEEETENLLRFVEEELRKRSRGNAVRLEVEAGMAPGIESMLLDRFGLTVDDCYRLNGPLTFLHLQSLVFSEQFPKLRDRAFVPVHPAALQPEADPFDVLRKQDVLVHHPYETFDVIVDFIERAAEDPAVLGIKLTLYRTSGDSPILRALVAAALAGKQVTVLMEIKARFDEENNIKWARKLEDAGVHVVYGMVGLKTHCKLMLVVRRDPDRIRLYAHIGTGNYHPRTAKLYTDLGLLTTDASLTKEVTAIFNKLTGLSEFRGFKKLLVAPFQMADRFLELINREAAAAKAGKPARIIVKLNSLVDVEMIRALYRASRAGVKIELIVRGTCCLRPGVPGVSDNIRVISIVGRFLEHSRIFYFENGGEPKIFIGSADWMPRNLYRRVEVVAPIEAPNLRRRIAEEILPAYLEDRGKARELRADGTYERLAPPAGRKAHQAQLHFRALAREAAKAAAQARQEIAEPIRVDDAEADRSAKRQQS
jgi:polyphosphate kinase